MVRVEHPTHILTFGNLNDDSSPDAHKAPSPKRTVEKHTPPPPSMPGVFLLFSFALFLHALIAVL
jgi:hypothetical protein